MKQRGEGFFVLNQPVHIDKNDYSVFDTFSIEYNINQLNEETATLKNPVEPAALEQAVDTLLYVFPTFRECCYIEDGELYRYYSDQKPSIFSDEGTLERGELNSGDVNPYQFRISYEHNKIRMIMSHALSDGHGMMRSFNTLLYYYFVYAGESCTPDADTYTLETPFDKAEFESGNDKLRKMYKPREKSRTPDGSMIPYAATIPDSEYFSRYELRFPVSQLMKLSKSTESSPISVILPFYAQALMKLCDNPKNQPLLIHAPLDLRPIFGQASMRHSSEELELLYFPKMKELPFDIQTTMIRGQIDMDLTFPEHIMPEHDPHMVMPMLARLPQNPERRYYAPMLSNLGRFKMSESMAALVEDMSDDAINPVILVSYTGITSFKDEVCMFFDHKFKDTSLFDTIREVFASNGITSTGHDCGKLYESKLVYKK